MRLKAPALITDAFRQNKRFVGRLMVLLIREGPGASLRLGVAAGKIIGGAVQRNRARRRLREAFRLNRHLLQGECDIVLLARSQLASASWQQVQAELIALADKAGLLVRERSS